MKVGLNIIQRIDLSRVLPSEANVLTLKMVRRIQDELALDEKERSLAKISFGEGGGLAVADVASAKDHIKEIEFEQAEHDMICSELRKLDEGKKLNVRTLELYEIFIEEKP